MRCRLTAVKGERQRRAIVDALRGARNGLDAAALAAAVGLHPNTVRWHLASLVEAGTVRAEPLRRRVRGRPRITYSLTASGGAAARDEYRLLAEMLAATVESSTNGVDRAYETGLDVGKRLRRADESATTAELLDREGFSATQRGQRIEMRRCPFLDLARQSPRAVCTLHRGILDGTLAAAGSPERVQELEVLATPGLCVAHLGS